MPSSCERELSRTVLRGAERATARAYSVRHSHTMRHLCIIVLAVISSFGCRHASDDAATTQRQIVGDGLKPIPPIADADPSIRHPFSVQVPTALLIRRTEDELAVGFAPLRSTNLTVGSKMVTGTEWEMHIYRDGAPVQLQRHPVRSVGTGLRFEPWETTFTTKQDGLPQAGEEYVVELRLTMFETDLPAQHMWSPQSGKHYRIMWTQTFRETVR